MDQQEKKLTVQVAYYYYKEGLTQSEIASRLSITRQKVNKLVRQSKENGIVEISIKGMQNFWVDIESKIEKKYHLSKCTVIQSPSKTDDLFEKLGIEGAFFLETSITSGITIGTSWGKTLHSLVTHLPDMSSRFKGLKVVQLVGSSNHSNNEIRPISITSLLSEKIGSYSLFLNAPAFVNESSRAFFMEEDSIKSVFDEMKKCDIVISSVGDLSQQSSSLMDYRIDDEYYDDLLKTDAVGNHFLQYLDINGNPVDCKLNKRRIGIDLNILKDIPNVVIVAGGKNKVKPIKAALNGGYVNTLITDYNTALKLIED